MRYWVTPFRLSATVCSTLKEAGLQPWPGGDSALPAIDSLLLYDSPDHLIAMAGSGPDPVGLSALNLLQGYRRLLAWSDKTALPLIAICHLQLLGSDGLRTWIADGDTASYPPFYNLPLPPLLAAVTLSLLEAEPTLLDFYSDLELRAALLGRDPDFRYQERLRQAVQVPDALLQDFLSSQQGLVLASELEQRLARTNSELQDAREATELSLLQLHQQVQEQREQHLLADGEKQRQLEARDRELSELLRTQAAQGSAHELELKALRELLESQLTDFEQRLASADTDLQEAKKAAEHSLLELHQQVQEEREQHVLADGEKQRQLEARDLELSELLRTQAAQESAHELELKALRELLESQLAELAQRLASADTDLQEAKKAAEHSLLELHQQVQEEREQYVLADGEKQRQLEARDRELSELLRTQASQESAHKFELKALRELLESQLAELAQRLASSNTELRQVREADELSMVQFHQVQEELAHYLLVDGEKQRQIEASAQELEQLRLTKSAQERSHELELKALRELFESQFAELEQRLVSRDMELREAREAAELSMLQLHQVQEDLEQYFFADG